MLWSVARKNERCVREDMYMKKKEKTERYKYNRYIYVLERASFFLRFKGIKLLTNIGSIRFKTIK